jgi:hypothetical protein
MSKPFPYNQRVDCRYGAPMGRSDCGLNDEPKRLTVRRVPLHEGYDPGGAYWGNRLDGNSLWCAWSPDRSTVIWFGERSVVRSTLLLWDLFPNKPDLNYGPATRH